MSGNHSNRPPLVADKRYPSQAEVTQKVAAQKPPPKPRHRPQLPETVTGWLWLTLRILGWTITLIWRFLWRGAAITTIILAIAVLYYAANLPPVADLLDGRARGSVTLLDRNDEIYAWRGEQFGGQVDAETVSANLKNAIIAAEDKRFYRHFGISPRGIASAARINMREGRSPLRGHGGSTISQQTAKLLCLGVPFDPTAEMSEAEYEADCREGSIRRKIKEAVFAMAMELRYSKDQILTIYLNRAYLGAGSRGFEAASQRYFGISAAQVDPAQAAMLAGLLTAPSRFAPTTDLQRSQDRAAGIITLMQDQGYLSAAQAQDARANPAQLSEAAAARAGGYFADWVMDRGPVFLTRETTEDVVIRTTFDQRIQDAAEQAVQQVFDGMDGANQEAQTAVVVMSADGAVRAMVGGRKFRGVAGQFNRAIQAKRQTGSAFKPFVYATALDLGFSYADTVLDEQITIDIPGSGPWTPRNYSEKFIGPVTLTDALRLSLNTPAVRVSEAVGRENVRKVASDFGIQSDLALGPALALGASEATLLEMTGAFAGILNGGSSVTPYGLIDLRLQGDKEPLMGQGGGINERVISRAAAEQLIYMMSQVVDRGTGKRAKLPDREAAGKTGTTQGWRDAWFLGFTADYVVGVWIGNDDNSTLGRITGGTFPADIWRETMLRINQDLPATPLPMLRVAEPPKVQIIPEVQPVQAENDVAETVLLDVLRSIFGTRER